MDRIRRFARVLRAVEKVRHEQEEAEDTYLVKAITEAVDAKARKQTMNKPVARVRYGVTQKQAAMDLGVSLRTVQKWEKGDPNPWGYSKEKRRTHATFAAFVAGVQRDLSIEENMLEGVRGRQRLHLGHRKGIGVKKGTK